jgi:hypothetical protein
MILYLIKFNIIYGQNNPITLQLQYVKAPETMFILVVPSLLHLGHFIITG